jgi:hypothetical protein
MAAAARARAAATRAARAVAARAAVATRARVRRGLGVPEGGGGRELVFLAWC